MYEQYYGLSGSPFRLTPDRRFFFGSEGHRKAMSYLKYGLYQGEGFIVVTGDVGTGKSTVVEQLFDEIDESEIVAANIGTTQIEADDAVRLIIAAFRIAAPAQDKASLLSAFEAFLTEQHYAGRRVLLVVDEAQNLPVRTLEELRMLSNFNISGTPLFQIFLVAQPQFFRVLSHPDLTQLQQRVIASYRLEPIGRQEVRPYIEHRLSAVGWTGTPQFTDDAMALVFESTGGVPRRINTLANRILLYGALEELSEIGRDAVAEVVADQRKETAVNQTARVGDGYAGHHPQTQRTLDRPEINRAALTGERSRIGLPGAVPDELWRRVKSIEGIVADHDVAIRELIDTMVNYLAALPDPAVEDDAAENDVAEIDAVNSDAAKNGAATAAKDTAIEGDDVGDDVDGGVVAAEPTAVAAKQ